MDRRRAERMDGGSREAGAPAAGGVYVSRIVRGYKRTFLNVSISNELADYVCTPGPSVDAATLATWSERLEEGLRDAADRSARAVSGASRPGDDDFPPGW